MRKEVGITRKVEDIIENNSDFLCAELGDSWEYDGVMEWYLKERENTVDVVNERGLLIHKARRYGVRVRIGHSHPERDYGTYTVDSDDVLAHLAGNYSNHHDFLMEGIINSFMLGDSTLAYILRLYVQGWAAKEIAADMNKSTEFVTSYLSRARSRIKKALNIDITTAKQERAKRPPRPNAHKNFKR